MKFQGAVVKEQGVTFAIVIVKKHVLDSYSDGSKTIDSFGTVFPGIPIVLTAQDSRGTPHYLGRTDIVRFQANVPLSAIPWKEYTLS